MLERRFSRHLVGLLAGGILAFAGLGGCSPSGDEPETRAAMGAEMVLNRGNTAEPESLDPALNTVLWGSHIIGDMLMGLYTDDAAGKAILGAASDATVSEDGRTWMFTLREHSWSDGTPVTAEDFAFAWRRIVDPKTASKYASLLYVFKNARPITEGTMPPSALGVRAADDKTLVLELENPAPYLPELLAHALTAPVPRHVIETNPNNWTRAGTYVANGPYVLSDWVPRDHVTLLKNPRFYDAANVKIDRVVFYPTEDTEAGLRRFRAGELDVQDPIPAAQIDWLRANMPGALRLTPILAIDYVIMNQTRAPFKDVRLREALSLAYDRELLTNVIWKLGETPAYNIVPPGTANYPGGAAVSFKDMPKAERITRAQSLMRELGYGPDKPFRTTYLTSALPDNRRTAAAVQEMWRQIYVDLEIVQLEGQVAFARIKEADFDIAAPAWIADFNDPVNFLFLLVTNNGGLNYGRYGNPKYDALLAQADQEKDVVKRGELLLEAEKIALAEHAWITRTFRSTRQVVQPHVKNWISNAKDVNRTRWLSVERPSS
jgi:oligopeptide transport system substrate-binding protein